ncbi:MAG: biotin/lipoyl-binding protein [Eudoraea sp.]|nr:biotin/lipoyl-binding protein [Eudoraea sp.]
MKKSVTVIILLVIIVAFGGSMVYLYQKNTENPVTYQTEKPSKQTIIKKTVATGSILPLEEVLIKPNISGVIEEVYVEGGDYVKTGDKIATIKVVPNLSALNDARNAIDAAKISLDDQKRNYTRQKSLFDKGVISQQDLERAQVAFDQARQSFDAANKRYDIVKTGTTRGLSNAANTIIRSTVSGMVLEVPVEVGNQVIESNNFNEGTTIAAIADVDKMIFEGKVDESEVVKAKSGYVSVVDEVLSLLFEFIVFIPIPSDRKNRSCAFLNRDDIRKGDSGLVVVLIDIGITC